MYRKEINEQNPLRILEQSTKGGLGPGNLGVVMARAGVGKTAFLVQIGLDDAMRERSVLHIALGQDLEHVHSWYDALFYDFSEATKLDGREQVRALMTKHRLIQAYADADLSHERLDELVRLFADSLHFEPKAILIDGFDWEKGKVLERAAKLSGFKSTAKRLGAELWMTARTHREGTPAHPTRIIAPCIAYEELIDVAVFLEPEGTHITVCLLKDHDNPKIEDTHLQLHIDTMRLATDDVSDNGICLPPRSFTLLSGGANGSEAAFGETAERWGVAETHFSFPGRETARKRGVVELTEEELEHGGVNEAYIKAQLNRSFPKTAMFQRLLKSIWHQVATAGEVYVIGEIQQDKTVKGGTGWGAELARHFHKPVYVFDQTKDDWFHWKEDTWVKLESPRIKSTRFTGTGTRFLSDSGRVAITKLFENSFGPPPK